VVPCEAVKDKNDQFFVKVAVKVTKGDGTISYHKKYYLWFYEKVQIFFDFAATYIPTSTLKN